jgi:hypothetical protein
MLGRSKRRCLDKTQMDLTNMMRRRGMYSSSLGQDKLAGYFITIMYLQVH